MPTKRVRIAGKKWVVDGLANDPYFGKLSHDREAAFVRFCADHLPDDSICIDIGANIGVTALALSEVARAGTIYAFEPSPTVYPLLVSNVRANRCRNIVTRQVAVADFDGPAAFVDNSAYGHLAENGGTRVPAETLATIIDSMDLHRIDFIKIDIEGYEYKVLCSGFEQLRRFDPIIYFEFNTWCLLAIARSDPVAFLEWIFATFPYVAKVNPISAAHPVTRMHPDDLKPFLHRNMLEESCVNNLVVSSKIPPRMDDARRHVRKVGMLTRLLMLRGRLFI